MTTRTKTLYLQIDGMSCQHCADGIRHTLKQELGVHDAQIDWESGFAEVDIDPAAMDEEALLAHRVFQGQYRARPFTPGCC